MDKIFWSSYRWEGYQKGKAEGKAEGKVEGMRELATQLLNTGKISINDIQNISGLAAQDLEQLVIGK